MKNLFIATLLAFAFSASASEIVIDSAASPGLYAALVKAGARPMGPATVTQTVMVKNVACSAGYNIRSHKAFAGCRLTNGDRKINLKGETARELVHALREAGIARGAGEVTFGAARTITCTKTNFDGLKTYECTARE